MKQNIFKLANVLLIILVIFTSYGVQNRALVPSEYDTQNPPSANNSPKYIAETSDPPNKEFFLPSDAILYDLNQFLFQVLPQSYVDPSELNFNAPSELSNSIIKRMAFRATGRVFVFSANKSQDEL